MVRNSDYFYAFGILSLMLKLTVILLFPLDRSPDGYSLFVCSLDGSVANFHFEAKELGYRLSQRTSIKSC
jgi:hypothetical protein